MRRGHARQRHEAEAQNGLMPNAMPLRPLRGHAVSEPARAIGIAFPAARGFRSSLRCRRNAISLSLDLFCFALRIATAYRDVSPTIAHRSIRHD